MFLLFLVIGFCVSTYLYLSSLLNVPIACPIIDSTSCMKVNDSTYSRFLGMPVSLLGIIGYSMLLINLPLIDKRWGFLSFCLMIMCALAFSVYLMTVSIFVIKALCIWCAVSAGIICIIAGLCIWNILSCWADYFPLLKHTDDA